MKKMLAALMCVCSLAGAQAEKNIVKYEFWFDEDASTQKVVDVAPAKVLNLNISLPPSDSREGIHTCQIRFQDSEGAWSSVSSSQFYVPKRLVGEGKITGYEYWFDNDMGKKTSESVTPSDSIVLLKSIAASTLSEGVHMFQIHFRDERGAWSSVNSSQFMKYVADTAGLNNVASYEYWFNDSISQKTTVKVSPVNPLNLSNIMVPVNSLNERVTGDNLHYENNGKGGVRFYSSNRFFIRFKDTRGNWSCVFDTTFLAELVNPDLTGLIINPEATRQDTGWSPMGNLSEFIQSSQHWSGKTDSYFHLDDTYQASGDSLPAMSQTISGLPAGTYTLTAIGRSSDLASLTMSAADVSVEFPAFGMSGGEIWEDAAVGSAEKKANGGKGYGWSKRSITFTTDGNPFQIRIMRNSIGTDQICDIDDFTLAIANVANLSVYMPDSAVTAKYVGYKVQVTNLKTSEKHVSVTTESRMYQFNGLAPANKYRVELLTPNGKTLCRIDSLLLTRGQNICKFDSIAKVYSVMLHVLAARKNVTAITRIDWYDGAKHYLGKDSLMANQSADSLVFYSVTLDRNLGVLYKEPIMKSYRITNSSNEINCQLEPVDSIQLSGVVVDEKGMALQGVSVSIAQLLNGKYASNVVTTTGADGRYVVRVYNDSSLAMVSAAGYLSKNIGLGNLNSKSGLDTIVLSPIVGHEVQLVLSYVPAVTASDTSKSYRCYSDYSNLEYKVYDKTAKTSVDDFHVQYPLLILGGAVPVSHQVQVSVTSRNGDVVPSAGAFTVTTRKQDTVSLALKQRGAVSVRCSGQTNPICMLFDVYGKFVRKVTLADNMGGFTDLPSGSYSLVSMSRSEYIGAVSDVSDLGTYGFVEGTDYVVNDVDVTDGLISSVEIGTVPTLDESRFYHTGSMTSFYASRTNTSVGKYVTLNARIDFKPAYQHSVKNVELVVSLPDSCPLVPNSVMLGSSVVSYTVVGRQLTVSVDSAHYGKNIRFCVMPGIGGTFIPTAFVKFGEGKNKYQQPIGSASFTASDLNIYVPEQTAKKRVAVSGFAPAFATVTIYDGATVIGQTTASGLGTWLDSCTLNLPYNLTSHPITAKIRTAAGLDMRTETKRVQYNSSLIEVQTVTMINTAHGPESLALKDYEIVFDFKHPKSVMPSYWYWPNYPDFTFKINFTNNDTSVVHSVTLYVKTSSNEVVPLKAVYDNTIKQWVATGKFGSNSLPVNLSVNYSANADSYIDGDELSDIKTDISNLNSDLQSQLADLNKAFDSSSDSLIGATTKKYGIQLASSSSFNKSAYQAYLNSLSETRLKQYDDSLYNAMLAGVKSDSVSIALMLKSLSYNDPVNIITPDSDSLNIQTCKNLSVSKLLADGFERQISSEGDTIYVKIGVTSISFASFSKNLYVSVKYPSTSNQDLRASMAGDICNMVDAFNNKLLDKFNFIKSIADTLKEKYEGILGKIGNTKTSIEASLEFADFWCENKHSVKYVFMKGLLEKQKSIMETMEKFVKKLSPLMDKVIPVADYMDLIDNARDNLTTLCDIYSSIPDPCPTDQDRADKYRSQVSGLVYVVGAYYTGSFVLKITDREEMVVGAMGAVETGGTSLLATLLGAAHEAVVSSATDWAFNFAKEKLISHLEKDVLSLECVKCDTCPKKIRHSHGGEDGGNNSGNSGSGNVDHEMDPSGYVYEAVASNRLQGVTTTVYQKSNEADMYGDKHEKETKWDAEAYLQKNPQLTDEYGVYSWFVPEGLWQVKYEKTGYETVYSGWLPVPPPQLDVNVGMRQAIAPKVSKIRGYETGVNIDFSKYMLPASIDTSRIEVSLNGRKVKGTLKLLNEEKGYADDSNMYVSKLRFVPAVPFTVDDVVRVMVRSSVESYMAVPMDADYIGTVVVEREIKSIIADSVIEMRMHGKRQIIVSVVPAEAAYGKVLTAKAASSSILSLHVKSAVVDQSGNATFEVDANLPGGSGIQFLLTGYDDLLANTKVKVLMDTMVARPMASISDGDTLYCDTSLVLKSATTGSSIYYTLDGTSPETSKTRALYAGPIAITGNVVVKAVAVKEGFKNSEVVELQYVRKRTSAPSIAAAENNSMMVYPNPSDMSNGVNVRLTLQDYEVINKYSLSILLMNGSLIRTVAIKSKDFKVSGLVSGTYVFSLKRENKEVSETKVVVK